MLHVVTSVSYECITTSLSLKWTLYYNNTSHGIKAQMIKIHTFTTVKTSSLKVPIGLTGNVADNQA
jgi:hypothetical protein